MNTAVDIDLDAPCGGFKASGTGRGLGGVEGVMSLAEPLAVGV